MTASNEQRMINNIRFDFCQECSNYISYDSTEGDDLLNWCSFIPEGNHYCGIKVALELIAEQKKQILSEKKMAKYFYNAGYERGSFDYYWDQFIETSIKIFEPKKYSWEV